MSSLLPSKYLWDVLEEGREERRSGEQDIVHSLGQVEDRPIRGVLLTHNRVVVSRSKHKNRNECDGEGICHRSDRGDILKDPEQEALGTRLHADLLVGALPEDDDSSDKGKPEGVVLVEHRGGKPKEGGDEEAALQPVVVHTDDQCGASEDAAVDKLVLDEGQEKQLAEGFEGTLYARQVRVERLGDAVQEVEQDRAEDGV